jgi:hypothetical protein
MCINCFYHFAIVIDAEEKATLNILRMNQMIAFLWHNLIHVYLGSAGRWSHAV